jgi:hypothetical protein
MVTPGAELVAVLVKSTPLIEQAGVVLVVKLDNAATDIVTVCVAELVQVPLVAVNVTT